MPFLRDSRVGLLLPTMMKTSMCQTASNTTYFPHIILENSDLVLPWQQVARQQVASEGRRPGGGRGAHNRG